MGEELHIREQGVDGCDHVDVCPHSCRIGCRAYRPRVDRDALLKLADDMDATAERFLSDQTMLEVRAVALMRRYATAVRGACGAYHG